MDSGWFIFSCSFNACSAAVRGNSSCRGTSSYQPTFGEESGAGTVVFAPRSQVLKKDDTASKEKWASPGGSDTAVVLVVVTVSEL